MLFCAEINRVLFFSSLIVIDNFLNKPIFTHRPIQTEVIHEFTDLIKKSPSNTKNDTADRGMGGFDH